MGSSERTCCICRARANKLELGRLVCCEGVLIWDHPQTVQSRGAYVHLTVECVSKMAQPGRWEHVLRQPRGTVKPEQLREVVKEILGEVNREPLTAQSRLKVARAEKI